MVIPLKIPINRWPAGRRRHRTFLILALVVGCLCMVASSASAPARPLGFSVNEKTGAIVLKDPRNGRIWEQVLLADQPAQRLISYDAKTGTAELECQMPGVLCNGKTRRAPFRITAKLDASRPAPIQARWHF